MIKLVIDNVSFIKIFDNIKQFFWLFYVYTKLDACFKKKKKSNLHSTNQKKLK